MKKEIAILIVFCLASLVLGLIYLVNQLTTESLCADFEPIEGEISCQEAIKIAKENFEGETISIKKNYDFLLYEVLIDDKKSIYFTPPPSLSSQIAEQNYIEKKYNIWFLKIKTNEIVKTIIINLNSGETLTPF